MNLKTISTIFLVLTISVGVSVQAQQDASKFKPILIETDGAKLELAIDEGGFLLQKGFGAKDAKFANFPKHLVPERRLRHFFPTFGDGFFNESAMQVTHSDGKVGTSLVVKSVERNKLDNGELVKIALVETVYKFNVDLFIRTFAKTDVFQFWTKITNNEDDAVTLYRYYSASPIIGGKETYLTACYGDWANEYFLGESKLDIGTKILDSRKGMRAHQVMSPMFILSRGAPADENKGEAFLGTLMWPGSFTFAFDKQPKMDLRVLCGVNHVASQYVLDSGKSIETPKMVFAYSKNGFGKASRNLHKWARENVLRAQDTPRPVLLNNWEATGFGFDEKRLVQLFEDAKPLGVEVFLLDDGWFGNGKNARRSDKTGLGDWDVNTKLLPSGLSYLCDEAKKRNMGFGIWLEPEMISPKSDLYEKHPDWAIKALNRKPVTETTRNQLVLDNTNPDVQAFEWDIFEKTLRNNDIKYIKWDCNGHLVHFDSNYLPKEKQSNLQFDNGTKVLELMAKFKKEFPNTGAMLCSGGGGRTDYASLQNFYSFWPSDNTDPLDRVKIQHRYSIFFPSNSISAHVTRMGKRPLKFCTDVAMGYAFGYDVNMANYSAEEIEYVKDSIKTYKEIVRPLTSSADFYRLESPHKSARASICQVSPDKREAIVCSYQIEDGKKAPLKIEGLDKDKKYKVQELLLMKGAKSEISGKTFTGAELLNGALTPPCAKKFDSCTIRLLAE